MDHYYDTAKRMHKSAKTLHHDKQFHNACYSAGYVVECYSKIIVGIFSAKDPRRFKHNVHTLSNELKHILGGNSSLSPYILDGAVDFANTLAIWDPFSIRYVSSSNEVNEAMSILVQAEIERVVQRLAKLELDGHSMI